MRPLAVLIGILMGTAASIAFGLALVLAVFLILGPEYAQLKAERGPLLQAVGLFTPLTALAAFSFIGQLRQTTWRRWPLAALVAWLVLIVLIYWPRGG